MAVIFAVTTPVGVAIGIGIQSSYNADSLANLIVSGIFDSISTGMPLFPTLTLAQSCIHRFTEPGTTYFVTPLRGTLSGSLSALVSLLCLSQFHCCLTAFPATEQHKTPLFLLQ